MDAFSMSEALGSKNCLKTLNIWEKNRLNEGKFIVNRSRELGKYLSLPKKKSNLIMPDVQDVLKDTAISLHDISDYETYERLE